MYYASNIYKLNQERFNRMPLWNFLRMEILSDHGVWLAGGSLQTLVDYKIGVNDYDLFFKDSEKVGFTRRTLERYGYHLIFECPKGELYTYRNPRTKDKVQLITKFYYGSIYDVLESFDIKAAMIGTDGLKLAWTKDAIKGAKKRIVELNKVTYPLSTLRRMVKYAKNKGYRIPQDTYLQYFEETTKKSWSEDEMAFYVD